MESRFDDELKLPDLGAQRLIVTRYSPVCAEAEALLVQAIENKRITEMTDVDVNIFVELKGEMSTVREKVKEVLIKGLNSNFRDGEQNGLVLDPESWLHGYLVHRGDKQDFFLGRPLLKVNGLAKLEELFPGIYPGSYESPAVSKKLIWNVNTWEAEMMAFCVAKYKGYGQSPRRTRVR